MEYIIMKFKGDGWTGTIRRPILSDAERAKREKHVIDTLRSVYMEEAYNEARAKELLHKESK